MTRKSNNLIQFWLTIGFVSIPGIAFGIAGYIRFKTGLFHPVHVDFRSYLLFTLFVTFLWAFIIQHLNLNRIATLLTLRTGILTAAKAST
ncbi:MAG: hypothetical protein ACRD4E_16275, partial [Bryobacteraceae bacterium]